MSKLVFLDVDDTLLSPPYDAVNKLAVYFGICLPPENNFLNRPHIDFYESYPDLFGSKSKMWLLALGSLAFGYFRSQKPLKFDIARVSPYMEDNRVYLVSKNPPSFTRWRIKRLKEIFSVNVGDRYIACGPIFKKSTSKLEIIKQIAKERSTRLSSCVIIDDSAENIQEAGKSGVTCYLVKSTWNFDHIPSLLAQIPNLKVISTEEIPDILEIHLGKEIQQSQVDYFVTPPWSPGMLGSLIITLFKRRFYYSSPTPNFSKIIPIARNSFTSLFYKDPHESISKAIHKILLDSHPSKIAILNLSKRSARCIGHFIPQDFCNIPNELKVRTFRQLCRKKLEETGTRFVSQPLFYFNALDKEKESARILQSPQIQQAMRDHVAQTVCSEEDAVKLVKIYTSEICASRTYFGCLIGGAIINLVSRRVFKKQKVHFHPKIQELESTHFLLYCAIHRSYLDSGLLYAALANQRMDYPFIVAADKMKKVWIGKLGSVAGALFLQRKFVNPLYASVLANHVSQMQMQGSSMEVFLEGKRSRSGLTLPPKKGIARIIWQNIGQNSLKKIALIPVSFSYNKLPESEILLRETHEERVVEGVASLREIADIRIKKSIKKSFFKKIRATYRRISSKAVSECYINFGEPIQLVKETDLTPEDSETKLQSYLNQVMFEINSLTSVFPSSALSLCLSGTRDYHIDSKQAISFLDFSKKLLSLNEFQTPQNPMKQGTSAEQLRGFLDLPFVNRKFKKFRVDSANIISITDLDIERSSYYRNNVLHFFVLPSILAKILMETGSGRVEELHRFLDHMFDSLSLKYFLPITKNSKLYINKLLRLLNDEHIIELKNSSYNLKSEGSEIFSLEVLARIGESLAQEDLYATFAHFRRSFERHEVDASVNVISFLRTGACVPSEFTNNSCIIRTEEELQIGDECEIISSRDKTNTIIGRIKEEGSDGFEFSQLDHSSQLSQKLSLRTGDLCTFTYRQVLRVPAFLRNISQTGALIATDVTFKKGDLLKLSIDANNVNVALEAKVTRVLDSGYGVQFQFESKRSEAELNLLLAAGNQPVEEIRRVA